MAMITTDKTINENNNGNDRKIKVIKTPMTIKESD